MAVGPLQTAPPAEFETPQKLSGGSGVCFDLNPDPDVHSGESRVGFEKFKKLSGASGFCFDLDLVPDVQTVYDGQVL